MFFSRFFVKDYGQLKAKGDKLFADGHFAEARHVYAEALDKLGSDNDKAEERNLIHLQLAKAANGLAELNIVEAEALMHSGNAGKGAEHLRLALEQADDVSLREKAESLLQRFESANHTPASTPQQHKNHGCTTCSSASSPGTELHDQAPDHLTTAEQFQLLINTLPGDLPQRYSKLGEKFASAYLLAHAEETGKALAIFQELLSAGENDIVLYEAALLYFRTGQHAACEELMQRALQINNANPLCYLGLAQLYIGSDRYGEAATLLDTMLARDILSDQALILLGDVHTFQGNFDSAIEIFTSALLNSALKKAAAERLVRILAAQGRDDEAAYLAKTYLKGCC